MSKLLTYGSVGGAPGNRCIYPEIGDAAKYQKILTFPKADNIQPTIKPLFGRLAHEEQPQTV